MFQDQSHSHMSLFRPIGLATDNYLFSLFVSCFKLFLLQLKG